jgi:hypothetical protein
MGKIQQPLDAAQPTDVNQLERCPLRHLLPGPGPGSITLTQAMWVSLETPWYLLKSLILWHIWCGKCAFDREWDNYHIGLVLYKAWTTMIHIGTEAWNDLQRHHRPGQQQSQLNAAFLQIWTKGSVFEIGDRTPMWDLIPPVCYMSEDLASRPASTAGMLLPPLQMAANTVALFNDINADFEEQTLEALLDLVEAELHNLDNQANDEGRPYQ